MDPYGTFGAEEGISKTQPSSNASTPKVVTKKITGQNSMQGAMPTYNWDQGHEQQRLDQRSGQKSGVGMMPNDADVWDIGGAGAAPGSTGEKIYKRPDGTWTNSGGDPNQFNDQTDFDWDSYLADIEELSRMTQDTTDTIIGDQSGGVVTGEGYYDDVVRDPASAGSNYAKANGRSGGTIYQGPVFDYPELNLPGPFEFGASLDLPDYEAPEYDEAKERAVREEFIQTNKGSLSKSAQQAILGSANVNNPQARGQIIKAALEGFGEALGQTTLKGSQEGRRSAEGKHRRDVGIYNAQFDVASKEALAGYDQSMREDLMNWELEVSTAKSDYSNQLANWNRMPNDVRAQNMPQ